MNSSVSFSQRHVFMAKSIDLSVVRVYVVGFLNCYLIDADMSCIECSGYLKVMR